MTIEEKVAELQPWWKRVWQENKDFCLGSNVSKEGDYRLQGNANVYGVGTRSYNRSAEKREMDEQRKEITDRYLASKGRVHEATDVGSPRGSTRHAVRAGNSRARVGMASEGQLRIDSRLPYSDNEE